jgi:predicted N-acyltransferase
VLLAGPSSGYSTDALVHRALSGPDRIAVQAALLDAFTNRLEADGPAAGAALYVTADSADLFQRTDGGTAFRLLAGVQAKLAVEWDDVAGYLRTLPPTRRSAVRREMRRLAEAGITVGTARLGEVLEEITPLLGQLQRRYGHRIDDRQVQALLERQRDHLDDLSVVFLAHQAGRLVGFSLFYEWQSTLWARAVGTPPPTPDTRFVYFDVLCYAPIRHAMARGLRAIDLGRGSLAGKLARGARPSPLWSFVWPSPATPAEVRHALAAEAAHAGERWRQASQPGR